MAVVRQTLGYTIGLAALLFLAGSAVAVPTPDAGGSRTVDEDSSYTYAGTDASGEGLSLGWDFDGAVIDGASVSFTFITPGDHAVSFWADDLGGNNVSDPITVTVLDLTAPVVDPGANQAVNEDALVSLDGSGTTDNDPNFGTTGRYYWTFNDQGTPRSLAGKTASYTFATPGAYPVTLLVLDRAGNFASASMTVTVRDITAPTGSATVPSSSNEDVSVGFSSTAITDNDPNFATNRRDYWTFTDGIGRNVSGASASYTFATPGTFSITLTVMDAAGNSITSLFSITIIDRTAPTGAGSVPSSANEDASVSFSSSSITDNDPTFSSNRRDYWTFTDGTPRNLSGASASWTFNTPGPYTITLTVMDIRGNTLTASFSLTIRDITAPTGAVSITSPQNEDALISFSSSGVSDNDPNFATNRRDYWTFTDGTARNLSGVSPTYTFATPGTFTITLLTMDAAGNRLTQTLTLVISDVTRPVPLIGATSLAQSRQQFSTMTHTGTSTDNVAVTFSGWAFTESGSPVVIVGATMTRRWDVPATYTLTFWARDAAGNNGTATTTFTVTADVTAPVATITAGPIVGDDQTAVTYTGSATDNNPNCATLCTWAWLVDGAPAATGSLTFTTTLTAGRHTVTFQATDPALNTGSASRIVDIDLLIFVDTTWIGVSQPLNSNVRISNGVTLLIQNSMIYNATTGRTVDITLTNGRLVIENTVFQSTSTTAGFRISATRTPATSSVTVLINSSTTGGLYDWLWVVDGTLAVRDSTFADIRGVNSGTISTVDSNVYLSNVQVSAVNGTTGGVRANFTSAVTLTTLKEVIFQNVFINATATPLRIYSLGVIGQVDVQLRDTMIRSGSTSTAIRGLDQLVLSSTGVFTNTFQRLDIQDVRGGGIYAVYQLFNGTVAYNVTDSNFSGSLGGNGTTFQLVDSSSQFSFLFANVAVTRSSLAGTAFRFVNTSLTASSWNQGTITFLQYSGWNNTQDGIYLFQQRSRLTASINIQDSVLAQNRRHGMYVDTTTGDRTALGWTLTDVQVLSNLNHGIFYHWQIQRVNVSFDMMRVNIENNTNDGFNLTFTQGTTFDTATYGNFWMNLTSVKVNTNRFGLAAFDTTSNGQWNLFINMVDSQLDFNRQHGMNLNYYMKQSYSFRGAIQAPYSNVYVDMVRSEASNNAGNGIYVITYYCGYGTTNSTYPSSCLFSFNLSESHVDNNNGRGFFATMQFSGYFGSGVLFLNINNQSTFNNNGYSGIQEYHYYTYMYNVASGRQSQTIYNIVNSTLANNGRVSASEGYGLYTYYYFDYYLFGQRVLNTDNASFIGNKNSGVRWYIYYGYFGQPTFRVNLINSTFTDNGGAGFDPYYYYTYNCGACVFENVKGNTFLRNALGAIRAGIPQSIGRYFSAYDIAYTNNIIDESPAAAISSYVTYSYTSFYYSGSNRLNISGNTITNVTGAAISYAMDPPQTGGSVWVYFSNNYIAHTQDTSALFMPGSTSVSHTWFVLDNTFLNTSTSALVLNMVNYGSGNAGGLTFRGNSFTDTAGTAFSLVQTNIAMTGLSIRDSSFVNSQTAIQLTGIQGIVDNVTFVNSIKEDIALTNGALEVHHTAVDPDKLVPFGSGSFSVFFRLKIYVSWAGSLRPATGSIVELADALGTTFFVGSVLGADGLPEFESLSYTKTVQGVLGRSPFRALVNYFELSQTESIAMPSDRVVNILLRDDVPPTMVLASPGAGFATRGTTIEVQGTAYDSHSGFTFDPNDTAVAAQFVDISTDNTNWQTPEIVGASVSEVQFRLTLTGLSESVRNVYIRIHDEAGNYFTRVVPVVLDATSPIVTILEAIPSITRAQSVHVVAETEVGASVFVNGIAPAELLVRPDGVHVFFEMDVAVIEGPNTITVMAMDALRNQGRVTVFVIADREAPYLVISDPEQDALVSTDTVTVMGRATDRNGVSVTVNGGAAVLDVNGNYSFEVPIAGDVTRIEVVATDVAGNSQILVRVVRFDDTAPWVSVESPVEGELVASTEVLVAGVVEQGATLVINGEIVDAPRGIFSRRILLVEGENTIHVEATDSAGNRVQLDRPVTVDTEKPTIQVTSIGDDLLWNRSTVTVAGRVVDEHAVFLTIEGVAVPLDADGMFSTEVALLEGTNVVRLEARDAAGNLELREVRVVRDTTSPVVAPSIEGLVPDGGRYYTTQSAVAVAGIAETGTIVEVCYTEASGGRACNVVPLASDGSFRTYVDLNANTQNSISVKATDTAGNSASREFAVTQADAVTVAAEAPVAAYGLLIAAVAVLGVGGYFLTFSRRSRGRTDELGSPEDLAVAAPLAVEAHGEMQVDVEAPEADMPAVSAAAAASAVAVPPDAPEAPKKARPMRRRPLSEGGGEGEGLTDKGTSAEGEAGPGESQSETEGKKEGGVQ